MPSAVRRRSASCSAVAGAVAATQVDVARGVVDAERAAAGKDAGARQATASPAHPAQSEHGIIALAQVVRHASTPVSALSTTTGAPCWRKVRAAAASSASTSSDSPSAV
ncbi:MAG: hypothetical protein R2851_13035 [Caldilineaceae bacterium]